MTTTLDAAGVQTLYDFWLELIPQFFGQLGVRLPAGDKAAAHSAGKAPPDWFAQWAAAMPPLTAGVPKSMGDAAAQAGQKMFESWSAMMEPYARGAVTAAGGTAPAAGASSMLAPWMAALPIAQPAQGTPASNATAALMQPFQATQKAWLDMVGQMGFASPQSYLTGFERTFGGLFDALGFGPMRKLQAGCQELAAASLAQNESRAAYAVIVQGAFTSGLERLMMQLGAKAGAGERVESVLTLLKMWAVNTEEAVHEVLQSEQGLAATVALTRAGLSHRRKLQQVAGIIADSLDVATRRELDDVYKELHELKRELRGLRHSAASTTAGSATPSGRVARRKAKS